MSLAPRILKPSMLSTPLRRGRAGFRNTPASGYTPNAVDFDGTNDYLTRGAGLDGAADSKLVSGGFWINPDTDGANLAVIYGVTTLAGGTSRFLCRRSSTNDILITGGTTGVGNDVLQVNSTAGSVEAADGWVNVLFSFNMADTGQRHLYIADASDLATVTTYADSVIDFTVADWGIGAVPAASLKLNGQISDLWFAPGYYIDFSVEANRRHFVTAAGGHPGTSPADGLTSLSVTAGIMLLDNAANYGTNSGNGGDFTITGSLTDTTPPA